VKGTTGLEPSHSVLNVVFPSGALTPIKNQSTAFVDCEVGIIFKIRVTEQLDYWRGT